MKKIIPLAVIVSLLFSACSVQETVDPQQFLVRLAKADENMVLSDNSIFYEENSCVCFFEYKENRFVIEQFFGSNGIVNQICVSSETDEIDIFKQCIKSVISVYAPEDDVSEITDMLFKEGYSYYESKWYGYSSFSDGKSFCFSVENKKLSPTETEKLTLREE